MKTVERVRMRIARFFDPIILSCWADWVMWALGYDGYSILPWKDAIHPYDIPHRCFREGFDVGQGCCYCLKYHASYEQRVKLREWGLEKPIVQDVLETNLIEESQDG